MIPQGINIYQNNMNEKGKINEEHWQNMKENHKRKTISIYVSLDKDDWVNPLINRNRQMKPRNDSLSGGFYKQGSLEGKN